MKSSRVLVLITLVLCASCARNLSSSHYLDTSASGVVLQGTVVSARPVTYSEADRLGNNRIGILGGGIGGGLVGSTIGGGSGQVAAIAGGAVIGAVAGAVVQSQLTKGDAMEYVIKINRKNVNYAPKEQKPIAASDYDYTNEVISAVQGTDVTFAPGQKVYIIYADDRPRVVARD